MVQFNSHYNLFISISQIKRQRLQRRYIIFTVSYYIQKPKTLMAPHRPPALLARRANSTSLSYAAIFLYLFLWVIPRAFGEQIFTHILLLHSSDGGERRGFSFSLSYPGPIWLNYLHQCQWIQNGKTQPRQVSWLILRKKGEQMFILYLPISPWICWVLYMLFYLILGINLWGMYNDPYFIDKETEAQRS